MGTYRIQWCWQGASGSAEDRFCNTFHFQKLVDVDFTAGSPSLGADILGALVSDADGFYKVWAGEGLASHCVNLGSTFKIYRLSDPEPRTPAYSFTYPSAPGMVPSTSQYLPSEVAICLSYEGIAAPGTNRARRRGRVYLGPLSVEAAEDVTNGCAVKSTFQSTVVTAFTGFVANMAALDCPIGIYSPTDDLFIPADHWWVDNAFDTQRRRGLAPYARITGP